jgi:hypothetical protein
MSRDADHLICGTGYEPDLKKLDFIDPQLLPRIQQADGAPYLDSSFECSVPRLHFAGAVAGYSFGPLCRFVAGTRLAARSITAAARQS